MAILLHFDHANQLKVKMAPVLHLHKLVLEIARNGLIRASGTSNWYEANRQKRRFRPHPKNANPTYLAYFLQDESKGNWRSEACYHAINFAVERIEDYYEQSFKNFPKVLQKRKAFIASLNKVKRIIIIGHSFSKVDLPYFEKIIAVNEKPQQIKWKISYHSDASYIDQFAQQLHITPNQLQKFKLS